MPALTSGLENAHQSSSSTEEQEEEEEEVGKKKKRRQKEVFEEIAAGVAGQFDVGEWQVHFVEKGGFN